VNSTKNGRERMVGRRGKPEAMNYGDSEAKAASLDRIVNDADFRL